MALLVVQVVAALLVASLGFSAMAADRTLGRPLAVTRGYFGMHMHRVAFDQPWPAIRFGSWRLWDSYTAWPNLEPQAGRWEFETLDKSVALAGQHDADLLLPLALSPPWASARPSESSVYRPGYAAEPAKLDDWRRYVRTVAQRYKGHIRYYEVWNEPDLKGFFSGSPEHMAELTRAACEELKAVDSGNVLIGPSPTSGPHTFPWYRNFLKALGPKQCIDIVGWHLYTTESAPEEVINIVGRIRAVLAEFQLEQLPLWNTEAGYFIENVEGPRVTGTIANTAKLILEQDRAAAYLARALVLAWAVGVDRYYWYAWDDGKMGLMRMESRAPKRAGQAYDRLYGWLVGASVEACALAENVWVCRMKRGERQARIVWRIEGQGVLAIPPDWNVNRSEELVGLGTSMSDARNIILGETPLLLISGDGTWN